MAASEPEEIVYSQVPTALSAGRRQSNPRLFDGKIPEGIKRALIVGHWPKVVAACRAAGVEVVYTTGVVEPQSPAPRPVSPPSSPEPPKVRTRQQRQTKALKEQPVAMKPEDAIIPPDWRSFAWPQKRALVRRLSDVIAINTDEADALIEAELARRAS